MKPSITLILEKITLEREKSIKREKQPRERKFQREKVERESPIPERESQGSD